MNAQPNAIRPLTLGERFQGCRGRMTADEP